jgi:hypothetical protein
MHVDDNSDCTANETSVSKAVARQSNDCQKRQTHVYLLANDANAARRSFRKTAWYN